MRFWIGSTLLWKGGSKEKEKKEVAGKDGRRGWVKECAGPKRVGWKHAGSVLAGEEDDIPLLRCRISNR